MSPWPPPPLSYKTPADHRLAFSVALACVGRSCASRVGPWSAHRDQRMPASMASSRQRNRSATFGHVWPRQRLPQAVFSRRQGRGRRLGAGIGGGRGGDDRMKVAPIGPAHRGDKHMSEVNISGSGSIDIGGDVVGRDKVDARVSVDNVSGQAIAMASGPGARALWCSPRRPPRVCTNCRRRPAISPVARRNWPGCGRNLRRG